MPCMIVAVTSDTHGRPFTVPPCDIFVHCGDMTAGGTIAEQLHFADFLRKTVQARYILIVPGNHDRMFQVLLDGEKYKDELGLDDRVHVLIDSGIEIEGKTFYGSPWTPPFFEWFFMAEENTLKDFFTAIPQKLDMLITHGPPYGILDPGWKDSHAGSHALWEAVSQRAITHHVFGHLHGAGGRNMLVSNTHFWNVAGCDEAYRRVNDPVLIRL